MLLHIKYEEKLPVIKRDSDRFRGLGALAISCSYVGRDDASWKSKQLESSKGQIPRLAEVLHNMGSHPAPPKPCSTQSPAPRVLQHRVMTPDFAKLSCHSARHRLVYLLCG